MGPGHCREGAVWGRESLPFESYFQGALGSVSLQEWPSALADCWQGKRTTQGKDTPAVEYGCRKGKTLVCRW